MDETEVTRPDISEMDGIATQLARSKASAEMWSVDIAVFMLGILAIILILLFQGIRAEIAVPIAIFGLGMGWFVGWRQGKRLYLRFYNAELARLIREFKGTDTDKEALEMTDEEIIERTLHQR